jgi:hypothetical protein
MKYAREGRVANPPSKTEQYNTNEAVDASKLTRGEEVTSQGTVRNRNEAYFCR